jgi:Holliday junction resolvase
MEGGAVSGGRAPKLKGDRAERLVVQLYQAAGFAAERTLKPGAGPGRKASTYDVTVPFLQLDRKVEVKCGAARYGTVYRQLGDNFALVVKADRKPPLIVIRLADAIDVAAVAEKAKEGDA